MESYEDLQKELDAFTVLLSHSPQTWHSKSYFGGSDSQAYINDFEESRHRVIVALNDVLSDGFRIDIEQHRVRKLKRLLEERRFSDTFFPVLNQERQEFLQITMDAREDIQRQYDEWKGRSAPKKQLSTTAKLNEDRTHDDISASTGCAKVISFTATATAVVAGVVWFWNKYPSWLDMLAPHQHSDAVGRISGTLAVVGITVAILSLILNALKFFRDSK
ncbi:MAG TPA: hypothetical protein VGL56_15425 [Fimbriimonadaceae bacterium]|jgi:hypothetical protein